MYGEQIDKELQKYSDISIRDYIRESVNIAHLHLYECLNSFMNREVEQCSSILSEMESIIMTYQADLDKAVDEIRNLQVVYCFSKIYNRMSQIGFLCD